VGHLQFSVAVFVAVVSTTLLPAPEEAALLGAGYAARLNGVPFYFAALAACAAVIVGDAAGYGAGRFLLGHLARTRIGRRLVPEPSRAVGLRLVAHHGAWAIVFARFLVGLRGAVYLAVGAARYPLGRFLAIDAGSAFMEVGTLVAVGFGAGELRDRASSGSMTVWVDGAVLLAGASAFVVSSVLRARLRGHSTGVKPQEVGEETARTSGPPRA
jgi:membrane protein DedA with SNARE-associated domain